MRLERVQLGTRLPADLEDVLEAARRHEDDAGATALEQGVGRHGRAVVQARNGAHRESTDALGHRAGRVVWRRAELQDDQPSPDECDEVGEGPAGVYPDDDRRPGQASAEAVLVSFFVLVSDLGAVVSVLSLVLPPSVPASLPLFLPPCPARA